MRDNFVVKTVVDFWKLKSECIYKAVAIELSEASPESVYNSFDTPCL